MNVEPTSPQQPRQRSSESASTAAESDAQAGMKTVRDQDESRRCLLIVEDNLINQLVARDVVRKLGYHCDIAANGVEALAALERCDYAAILMDCNMPEMDGFDATLELRRREGQSRHTPIIAMTAGSMSEYRERCAAAGMDDYVPKPVDVGLLESVLTRWVGAEDSGAA